MSRLHECGCGASAYHCYLCEETRASTLLKENAELRALVGELGSQLDVLLDCDADIFHGGRYRGHYYNCRIVLGYECDCFVPGALELVAKAKGATQTGQSAESRREGR